MKLNVIIPMAGLGSRFKCNGFLSEKYLLPLDNSTMIEKAVLTLINKNLVYKYYFILRNQENINTIYNYIKQICIKYNFNYDIIILDNLTDGPASSVYEALKDKNITGEIIISNSDQVMCYDFNNFYEKCKESDGCVITYKPDYELLLNNKDKHSFIKLDNNNNIIDCEEKKVLSNYALVGIHYYKNFDIFKLGYNYIKSNNIKAENGELYFSLTYKALIHLNYNILYYNLKNNEKFYPVGTPDDYLKYYNINNKIQITNFKNTNLSLDSDFKTNIIENNTEFINEYKNTCCIVLSGNITINNVLFNENEIYYSTDNNIKIMSYNTFKILYINTTCDFNKKYKHVNDFFRGWLIGNFEPSIFKTTQIEYGLLHHSKNELWGYHYHENCDEYNILLKGQMNINNLLVNENQIFIIKKNIIACPEFKKDCKILCIKTSSNPKDKILI